MPKDGEISKTRKTPAERKFAARIALRTAGKKQKDFAPPKNISFFATPPVAVKEPGVVAEVKDQPEEHNYYFETPAGDAYAVVGTSNAPNYNWTAWFLGCGMQLTTDAGEIRDPFWYACAPAIGTLCPVNDTQSPVGGAFPPDLTCLKSSCPPYIGGSSDQGAGSISLPSIDPSILLIILAGGSVLILAGCLIKRSYMTRALPPQHAGQFLPLPQRVVDIPPDDDQQNDEGWQCRVM